MRSIAILFFVALTGAGCINTTLTESGSASFIHNENDANNNGAPTNNAPTDATPAQSDKNTPSQSDTELPLHTGKKNPQLSVSASAVSPEMISPIGRAGERVTKKPFGKYVTPKNSPVSPEVFTGYHTGVDFEVFEDELDAKVSVTAICTGNVREKRWVTGYGGVVIQDCTINGQKVTVLYGHLKIDSVTAKIGGELRQGTNIGILGKGYSQETSNERKHLHLSIHKGTAIHLKGYVQSVSELSGWIDIEPYIVK